MIRSYRFHRETLIRYWLVLAGIIVGAAVNVDPAETALATPAVAQAGDEKPQENESDQDRIFSGPQPGEKITPFKVLGVKDDQPNELEIVKETKGTTLICFVHRLSGDDRILYGLPLVDFYASRHEELTSHFVLMSDDRAKTVNMLRGWARGSLFTKSLVSVSVDGATIIDFSSTLRSSERVARPITLDGDPQHAGVQFRAAQQVAESTSEQTYFVRPDGVDVPGSFRNWSDKPDAADADRNHVDLPWHAMCFKMDMQYFTCCYLDHPENAIPARHSERAYGRFGAYVPVTLTARSRVAEFKYRFVIKEGEMTPTEIERYSIDYTCPPKVTVVR